MISERKHTSTAPWAIGRSKPAARAAAASMCSGFTSPKTRASASMCSLDTRRSNRISTPLEVLVAVACRDVPARGIAEERVPRRAEAALDHEKAVTIGLKADHLQQLAGLSCEADGDDHVDTHRSERCERRIDHRGERPLIRVEAFH